ncbi:oligoendopeptidase F [candidate division KSB1 bacterium]|nr:oligoendopeptidase F [candidate division KSB1 bacterium]
MRRKLFAVVKAGWVLGSLICLVFLLGAPGLLAQEQAGKIPTRDQIEEQYKWNLGDIYASDDLWEQDFSKVKGFIPRFKEYEGILRKSPQNLLGCLKLQDEVGETLGRLFLYAYRRKDEDLNNTTYQALADRVRGLATQLSSAAAFIRPEILSISERRLRKFHKKEEGLAVYEHYLGDITRTKPHTLPKEQEEILALAGEVMGSPYTVFGMLDNADFSWPSIKDEEDNEVEMSKGRYYMFMYSPDRRVRHDAYKEFYVPYEAHKNTLGALFSANIKSDIFYMKNRKYNTCLEASLNRPNIPVEVYNNLITTIHNNLGPLHRWAALKKKVMELDELHPYDTYAPLFAESTKKYTFEEAKEMVKEALRPLGEDYIKVLKEGFENRWIDVYENVGKRGGAYSAGTYGVHPYVLLNYNGTLNDVFTLAHEMGHTIHTYYTIHTQPFIYSDYATFVAEVASTTNEALLMDYLLKKTEDKDEKLALLQKYIGNIMTTFYRQTRFADFEKMVHDKAERGEALTPDVLDQLFGDLYQQYWGPEMVVDPEEKLSWARIPHFYYNFYVYTYATSYAASQAVSQKILTEGEPAVKAYLNFLSRGSSAYPIDLLKGAGVDMSTPEPIEATTKKMDELIDQVEAILAEK